MLDEAPIFSSRNRVAVGECKLAAASVGKRKRATVLTYHLGN